LFYGWYIVTAGAIINAFIGGITFYGFTAMMDPIARTFGWSYAQISLAMTLRGVESGVLNPFTGLLADRFPAKWLVFIGMALLGLGLLILSQVTSLAMFYVSFLIIALGGSLGLYMAPTVTVVRWFRRNVGKAIGLMTVGWGVGGLLVPVITALIDTYRWRTSLIILAVGIWVLGIPLAFVFRSRPEDYGLLPDGKPKDSPGLSGSPETYDVSVGAGEALRMRAFWHISLTFLVVSSVTSAVVLHVMPYLASLGVERSTASMMAMFIPIVSIPSRFAFGWLCDVVKRSHVIIVCSVITSVGVFLFSSIDGSSSGSIVGFVIVFGLGLGGVTPLMAPILRQYFGARNFGAISGLAGVAYMLGSVITPPLAGWVFDTRGVYHPMWLILGGVCLLGAVLMLTIPPPPGKPGQP